jgi:5,10-methylene-tetrahydrofolate dehydrogenase/methenyl tetrahydrofolate cyclohydrolase
MALVLDGKACVAAMEATMIATINELDASFKPTLVLILVGLNPNSKMYI